jgi:uncharacterized membrane protein
MLFPLESQASPQIGLMRSAGGRISSCCLQFHDRLPRLFGSLERFSTGRAGTVALFLKFVHLAAIAIWSGGLIALPFLFRQRRALAAGPDLDRLHRIARFVYVEMTSPAAFIAIASGTALIFLQATFAEWFSLKMVLVGAMVVLHVAAGLVLLHLFAPEGHFSRLSYVALTSGYVVVITAILGIVLAKPKIDSGRFAAQLFVPGGLARVTGSVLGRNQNADAVIKHELAPVPAGEAGHHRGKPR